MQRSRLELLNIVLMLVSAALAWRFPFALFLFVYALLGPLHYLTEINWLEGRNFFLRRKNDVYFILAIIVLLPLLNWMGWRGWAPLLIFMAFSGSVVLLQVKKRRVQIIALLGLFALGLGLNWVVAGHFKLLFSVFLPSIIHVFIFTGLFILVGALRAKNALGLLSLTVFLGCALFLLLKGESGPLATINAQYMEHYGAFRTLNLKLIDFFHWLHLPELRQDWTTLTGDQRVFFSETGRNVMRLVAFAYTYHYLNWFSKTSVIQWHKTSRLRLALIVLTWLLSAGFYLYDYVVGLRWLYVLSMAHVLLEFPLNHKSVGDIFRHLRPKTGVS